jgi:hypothetical protein
MMGVSYPVNSLNLGPHRPLVLCGRDRPFRLGGKVGFDPLGSVARDQNPTSRESLLATSAAVSLPD